MCKLKLYSVRNSVGRHNDTATHNSKAVLSVFIHSKVKIQAKNPQQRHKTSRQKLKTQERRTKGQNSKNHSDKKCSTAAHSEDQTNWQGEGRPGFLHKRVGTMRHRWDTLGTLPQVGGTDWLKSSVLILDTPLPQVQNTFYCLAIYVCLKMNYTLIWIEYKECKSLHHIQTWGKSHTKTCSDGIGKGTPELLKTTSLVFTEAFTPLLAKILTIVKIQMSVSTTVMLLL